MGLFTKKKDPLTPEQQQALEQEEARLRTLSQLDGTRMMAEQIYTTLRNIRWDDYSNSVNIRDAEKTNFVDGAAVTVTGPEFVNDAKRMVNTILVKMGKEINADLVAIQSERIDAELLYFAEQLEESLKNADLYSAEACITGLFYGIWQGHRSIPSTSTAQEKEDEISLRQQKIKDYKQIVKVSKKMKKMDNTRKNLIALYTDEVEPKYARVHEEFLKKMNEQRHLFTEISGYTGHKARLLSDEHFEAWRLTTKNDNLFKTTEQLGTQIEAISHNISEYEDSILQIKNAAQLEDMKFDAELQMEIDQIIAAIPDKMTQMLHNVIKQQESLDRMFNEFNAALNDPDVTKAMAKTMYQNQMLANELAERERKDKEDEAAYIQKMEEEAIRIEKELTEEKPKPILNEPKKKKIIKH